MSGPAAHLAPQAVDHFIARFPGLSPLAAVLEDGRDLPHMMRPATEHVVETQEGVRREDRVQAHHRMRKMHHDATRVFVLLERDVCGRGEDDPVAKAGAQPVRVHMIGAERAPQLENEGLVRETVQRYALGPHFGQRVGHELQVAREGQEHGQGAGGHRAQVRFTALNDAFLPQAIDATFHPVAQAGQALPHRTGE